MSAPAQEPSSPIRSLDRRDQPGWFVLSLVLHVVAGVILVFFTPIRDVLWQQAALAQRPTRPEMSTQQLSEVAQRLDEITEDHIERNVEAMHRLIDQMQEVNDERFAEYVVFEHSQIERSPEVVDDNLELALAAMQQAAERIQADDHTAAVTQQALAISHQEAIEQRLELIQASPEVRQSQQQASQTQQQAAKENERADLAVQTIQDLDNRLRYPESVIPTLEARVPQQQQSAAEAETKLQEYQANLTTARREQDQANSTQDAKAIERAARLVKQAEDAVERAERSLATKQSDLANTQVRLEEFQTQVAEHRTARDEQQQIAAAAHEAATQLQATAIQQQTEVAERIRQEVAERVAELTVELDPNETVQQVLVGSTPPPATQRMNALELYEAALSAEQQLAEKYRQGRAMRLAIIQDVPFAAALDAIDRVVPVRPELPAEALTADARDEAQLEAKKEAVRAALSETNSMVTLGNALLTQAIMDQHGAGRGGGPGRISLAAIQARSAQSQQLAALADQATSGRAVDLAAAMQAPETRDMTPTDEPVPVVDSSIRPVAGRKVADIGEGAEWMAVTQWYMLGPFANPGRANIDRVFPPETLIDMNAVYVGKDDRTIQWTFTHTEHELGRLTPTNDEPYGIWYAYTELDFDRPRDLWITMGSDDKGRVWVNDDLVWVSESHHKIWDPAEAQRRVHFRQGRNKVLFRIENGQHGMVFSLWVRLDN